MLRNVKELENYAIAAVDGPIGHVKDLYFDDDAWVLRYLVVDAGSWLQSRKVLISPISIRHPNWAEKSLPVVITKEQVRNSPDIDTHKPVSRQQEEQYLGYYGYPGYWGGAGMWGVGLYPYAMVPGFAGFGEGKADLEREEQAYLAAERTRRRNEDPHLRSCNAVIGYHLSAADGEVGHVSSLVFDEETWAIRYLVVDTGNWWGGHKVLIAPQWVTGVHWSDRTVSVDVRRDAIKSAKPYDSTEALNREQERSLYRHHRRDGYWADGSY